MFDSLKGFRSKILPMTDPANRELADILAAKVIPKDSSHSYDATMKGAVTNLLLQGAIPWLASCFEKYSEEQFHQKMAEGFNFIEDWQQNHKARYTAFIFGAKAIKNRFYWNSGAIVEGVVEMLQRKGWSVYRNEQAELMRTVETVRTEIYGQ